MMTTNSSYAGARTLWILLKMRTGGGLRRRFSSLRTFKGMIFFLLTFMIYGFWLTQEAQMGGGFASHAIAKNYFPFALLCMSVITVATSTPPAIYFSPAEIHFLISRPFGQKALLLYKVGQYAVGALLSAVLVGLVLPGIGSGSLSSAVGTFQTMFFMQMFNVSMGLLGQRFAQHWHVAVRTLKILAIAGIVWILVGLFIPSIAPTSISSGIIQSPIAQILTSPFVVFAKMLLAETTTELFIWAVAATAINGLLLAFILSCNVSYVEDAARTSSEMFARWQRSIQHGRSPVNVSSVSWSLPQLPFLRGAGSIVWRQLTTALRTSPKSIIAFSLLSLATGPLVRDLNGSRLDSNAFGLLVIFSLLIIPRALLYDFRGDQDRLNWLRVLPMSPWYVALGEIAVPAILATLFHWLQFGSLAITMGAETLPILVSLAILSLPFNLLLFSAENLIFLLFPTRLVPVGRMDFEFFGRSMVEFVIKCTLLAICITTNTVIAITIGASFESFALAVFIGFTLAMTQAACLVSLLGWAFKRAA